MFNVAGLSFLPLFFTYGTMSTFKYNPVCPFTIQNPLKRSQFLCEKYQNDYLASCHPDSEVFIWEIVSGSVGCTIKVSKGHRRIQDDHCHVPSPGDTVRCILPGLKTKKTGLWLRNQGPRTCSTSGESTRGPL